MKELGPNQQLVADVLGAKGVVGARVMQEYAVDARRVDDDRVGTSLTGHGDHTLGQVGAVAAHYVQDGAPQQVVADLAHQLGAYPQPVEVDPGIGDRSSRAESCRTDCGQSSGRKVCAQISSLARPRIGPDRSQIGG